MAAKSPRQFHTQWPNVSGPTELPNVSGASIQDAALEIGDSCYSISDSSLYVCTTATVGSAVWVQTGGIDADAIHDNVAGEIAAVAAKATPVSGDYLLIEDSADSNNKKSITIGSLPSTDSDAIHDNVAGEIAAIASKATPTPSDIILIEDAADSNNKKSITIGDIPASGGGGGEFVTALNSLIVHGASAGEFVLGQTVIDGSLSVSFTFKALVTPTVALTVEVRLYDMGPIAGPPSSGNLVSTLSTASSGLQYLDQTLTAVADPTSGWPDNDQIYNVERMYEARLYISGASGDQVYVGKVSIETTEVV